MSWCEFQLAQALWIGPNVLYALPTSSELQLLLLVYACHIHHLFLTLANEGLGEAPNNSGKLHEKSMDVGVI